MQPEVVLERGLEIVNEERASRPRLSDHDQDMGSFRYCIVNLFASSHAELHLNAVCNVALRCATLRCSVSTG